MDIGTDSILLFSFFFFFFICNGIPRVEVCTYTKQLLTSPVLEMRHVLISAATDKQRKKLEWSDATTFHTRRIVNSLSIEFFQGELGVPTRKRIFLQLRTIQKKKKNIYIFTYTQTIFREKDISLNRRKKKMVTSNREWTDVRVISSVDYVRSFDNK